MWQSQRQSSEEKRSKNGGGAQCRLSMNLSVGSVVVILGISLKMSVEFRNNIGKVTKSAGGMFSLLCSDVSLVAGGGDGEGTCLMNGMVG